MFEFAKSLFKVAKTIFFYGDGGLEFYNRCFLVAKKSLGGIN